MTRILLFVLALAIAAPAAHAAEITVSSMQNGKPRILISGRLNSADVIAFGKQADAARAQYHVPYTDILVWLDSLGGDMETIAVGTVIHDLGMPTYVADKNKCLSVCAWIWLGGRMRWVGKTAVIGFHMPKLKAGWQETRKDVEDSERMLGWYYGYLGLRYDFMEWSVSGGDELRFITPDIANKYRVEYHITGEKP